MASSDRYFRILINSAVVFATNYYLSINILPTPLKEVISVRLIVVEQASNGTLSIGSPRISVS